VNAQPNPPVKDRDSDSTKRTRAASAGPDSPAARSVIEALLTGREVAAILRISPRTLWGITYPRGALHSVRVGGCVRYRPSEVQRYLARGDAR